MRYLWLLIPLVMALLQLATGRYIFSALVSVSCAAVALVPGVDMGGLIMAAGLLVSVAGDALLAHQAGHPNRFIEGVACFGAAHVIFAAYAARRFALSPLAAALVAALAALYALYLARRVLPGQPRPMKIALGGYAAVSLAGLFFALSMTAPQPEYLLYALGIAAIVFSDTMIAEAEFARNPRVRWLILPTYYLCHILLAASRLA